MNGDTSTPSCCALAAVPAVTVLPGVCVWGVAGLLPSLLLVTSAGWLAGAAEVAGVGGSSPWAPEVTGTPAGSSACTCGVDGAGAPPAALAGGRGGNPAATCWLAPAGWVSALAGPSSSSMPSQSMRSAPSCPPAHGGKPSSPCK